ncbi:MAG: hypothetical protein OXC30_03270 [Alphaproteobacteria bacterium]|nr:hypothetical protein [Alphaproteobacteria bacterium]
MVDSYQRLLLALQAYCAEDLIKAEQEYRALWTETLPIKYRTRAEPPEF